RISGGSRTCCWAGRFSFAATGAEGSRAADYDGSLTAAVAYVRLRSPDPPLHHHRHPARRCDRDRAQDGPHAVARGQPEGDPREHLGEHDLELVRDRKSTRLNSSHEWISYAVFCLKKKKKHT